MATVLVVGCPSDAERPLILSRPDASGVKNDVLVGVDNGPAQSEVVSIDAGTDVAAIEPGEFGWACSENDDCSSGWCVEGATAQGVCTQFCFSTCPDGWACRPIGNAGSEVTYVCVQRAARLCWPCRDDSDCRSATSDPDASCVNFGDAGSFCGVSCVDDKTCPEGYRCATQESGGGQCVPTSGECACNERAEGLALSTDCESTNTFGVCPGARGCTDAGLGACSARVPAEEICNGVDDDCDGKTDDSDAVDCVTYYPDEDGDGFGIGGGACLCASPGLNYVTKTGDCSDVDGNVNPGATESCNFLDDDCDNVVDEPDALGCTLYGVDDDEDGYAAMSTEICRCTDPGLGFITAVGDCNDDVATISPVAQEKCDGIDNDCDGKVDEDNAKGCVVYYSDKDGDGYGKNTELHCSCNKPSELVSDRGGDCNDNDTAVHPLAPEVCNFVDDNCDGTADESGTIGCGTFYKDVDQDGFGSPISPACLCRSTFPYTATEAGDCDDNLSGVRPGGNEICNGVDDDCDGMTDGYTAKDCLYYFVDADQDGFGDINKTSCLCAPTAPWSTLTGGDCNDKNPIAFPGAQELCAPGDENCNGVDNEAGALGCANFYKDADGDGYGTSEFACICQPAAPYNVVQSGDCYDEPVGQAAFAHPGQGNWFTTHRGDGSFDFNCDGSPERENTLPGGNCSTVLGFCSATQKGFRGAIPDCGQYGDFLVDCDSGFFSCDDVINAVQQRCR